MRSISVSHYMPALYRTFVRGLIVGVLFFMAIVSSVEAAPIQQYSGGLVVYADGSTGVPKYKVFDDTTGFGAEQSATAVGSTTIEWIRVAASPTRDEWIIVTRDAADMIVAQVCTGSDPGVSCGATTTISATAGTHGLRNFDVAYEQSSGDALVVYGTATADELRKIEWNGSSWTGDAAITTTNTSGTVEWVELTSRPASDQIAIGYSDSNDDISAYRWSGSSVGNEATSVITASGSTGDVRKFDVSFEGTSGDMIVAAPLAGAGTTALGHMTSAGTWTIVANTEPDNITSYIDLQEVGPDDDVAMIAYGTSTANNPTEGYELNGATPNTTTTGMVDGAVAFDTTTLNWVANYFTVSVAYLSSTYYAVAAFSDVTGADDVNWWTMDSSGVWTVQTDNTRTRGTVRFTDMFDYPNSNKVLLLSSDANSDLWADTWAGAATGSAAWTDVTSGGAIETALSSATTDVYDFAFRLSALPVSISGTLYSFDRTTTATSGYTIKLAIATSATPTVLTATTTGGGVWSFDSLNSVVTAATSGTPYTIWLDGTSTKATTLLMGNASSSAGGVPLYMGHLAVNGSSTASVVNLQNFWAYDSTDDSDILYTISGTAATTTADFFIKQGSFTPTATFAIGGDYTNNGTFTHGSGTVQFVSTTTAQRLGGTLTGTSAFHNVQFAGTSTAYTRALGYWTFNSNAMTYSSATVGTSTDLSGNNHSGTLVNMSTTTSEVTGYLEKGLYFDGTNDRVSVSGTGTLDGLSTMTVCAWVKPDSASTKTYPQVVSTYDSSEVGGWDLYLVESGTEFGIGSSFRNDGVNNYTFKEHDNAITADVWTHVCVKQNGDSANNIYFYRNGLLITDTFTSDSTGSRTSDAGNALNIGDYAMPYGNGNFMGVIDEVQVYDEYLTDTEIYDIYQTSSYYFAAVVNGSASTTALTVASGTTLYATSSLTVFGDYTNSGTLISSSTSNFYLTGSGVTATGTMTGTSSFSNLVVTGAGTKTFGASASTTNFSVLSTSGEVVMPPTFTVSGNYTNNSTTTAAGAVWQAVSAAGNNDTWSKVIYAEDLFVTVSDGSDNYVMTSPDGVTWTTRSAAGDNDAWYDITYGNGLFVAVGPCGMVGGDCVITSPDGITWTAQSVSFGNDYWEGVTYGNGLFVAVGDNGDDRIMTSPDGITWTDRDVLGVDDYWTSVTYGNSLFVAVGNCGAGGSCVMTSPDGITWTAQSAAGNDDSWRNVVYGNGLFVAVGENGDKLMTSPDGITWTARSVLGNNDSWQDVAYLNGLFVAVGITTGGKDAVMTSPDGINWTARSAAGNNDSWYGVTYGNGRFVAVGSGPDVVMVSLDSALYVASSAAQTLSGNLTGASQLRSVTLSGAGTKTFSNNASTTDFTVLSSSGEVLTPTALSVAGDYTNSATTSMIGATWTSQTASGNNDNWNGVAYGNGTFVAVGFGGDRIMTSADGITWTAQSGAGDNDPWVDVTYGNGLFVAVSDGSGGDAVMTSPDGVTWTARSAAGNNDSWYGVTYGNGLFVAVGYAGDRVMTSPDGINWTVQSAVGNDDIWSDVVYGNGLFVAVGDGGPDYVMTSPDGITWTARSAAGDNDFWIDVTYGNGLFVAVGYNGDRVMTSPDGVTWTVRSAAGDNDQWWGVIYGDGLFVAVSKSGDRVMTSPDGITWTVRSAAGDNDEWYDVAYGNGTFVAVSYTGGDSVITSTSTTLYLSGTDSQVVQGTTTGRSQLRSVVLSEAGTKTFAANASTTDFFVATSSGEVVLPAGLTVSGNYANYATTTAAAATWSPVSVSDDNDAWTDVAYGNGTFVAVTNSGVRVMTSTDGVTWSARTAAGDDDMWSSVTYGKGRFVAVGYSGNRVITSPDGITWTAQSAAGDNDLWVSVTYGNGTFVAIGLGDGGAGGDRVMTSPDGVTWTVRSAVGDNDYWTNVTYGNGLFVAVGDDTVGDAVMTSPDGVTWTARTAAGTTEEWQSVTYGNGLFVAVASAGTHRVMTSPDGMTWTARTAAGNDDAWSGLVYGNGTFVAVGLGDGISGGDRVMTSPDGMTWTVRSAAGNDDDWYGVAYGNGRFVAVANSGVGERFIVSIDTTGYFAGEGAQSFRGSLSGASQLRSVILSGNGVKTFSANASTTSFFNATSSSTTLPTTLSVAGDYTNYGTIEAGSGTVYLTGAQPQTIRGTLTATSSFNNLYVKNYSPTGTTTFASAVTVDGALSADGGTYLALAAGATSTVATLTLNGSSTAPVSLGSTATGTKMNFVLTGTPTVTYTTVFDSNACGSTGGVIDVSGANNTDGGNTECWSFVEVLAATVALASDEHFYVGQATTTLGTVTITDDTTATITTTGDIRLSIATTTTNFRFDVGVTSLTFGGTASGKVSNPVSYEDGGATLVIPVSSNFSSGDTLTVSGITVGAFGGVATTTSQLALHTDGNSTGAPADTSTETISLTGSLAVAEHDAGQATNKFSWQNQNEASLYTFKLTPNSEQVTITDLVVSLAGVQGVVADDLTNLKLYIDGDADGVYDAGETQVGGSGILTLNGQAGAITFSSDFTATTARSYILIGDTTTIAPGAAVVFSLEEVTGITTIGVTSGQVVVITGSVSDIQHIRNTAGGRGGGVSDRIGGEPPAGGGVMTGGGTGGGSELGDTSGGDNISPDVEYLRPTSTSTPSEWTNPENAYASDGNSATAATNALRQTFINFDFGIPGGNTIQGIAVKLDASGSTAAGTIDVALSWDGGSSYTSAKATPTLGSTDSVYTVGGPADTWGRSWSVGEFSNENFRLRVTANTSSNTLRLDGLEIRIYHQASGGGSGGGGGI